MSRDMCKFKDANHVHKAGNVLMSCLPLQANESYCGGGNPACGPAFAQAFMDSHAANARAAGKPIIMEEFGKTLDGSSREALFETVYRSLNASLGEQGGLKGDHSCCHFGAVDRPAVSRSAEAS